MHISSQGPLTRQGHQKVRKLVDLTRKFFAIACNHEEPFEFTIKDICDKLAIESRRLYDLINVLEALGIIIKRQGSHYEFIGLALVDQAVQSFVSRAIANTAVDLDANSRFKLHELSVWFMGHIIRAAPGQVSLASIESTLGLKSSQVRRLYDITNILEGMHLITIINQRGTKPSYSWNNEKLSTVCRSIIIKAEQMSITSGQLAVSSKAGGPKAGSAAGGTYGGYTSQRRKRRLYRGAHSNQDIQNDFSSSNSSNSGSSSNSSLRSSSVSDDSDYFSYAGHDRRIVSPNLAMSDMESSGRSGNRGGSMNGLPTKGLPHAATNGGTPTDESNGKMHIIPLSSPSKAVLTSGHDYFGISRDTPQTRRFVSSLIKLSQDKEKAVTLPTMTAAASDLNSITPQGTIVPVGKNHTDQTPNLQKIQSDICEGSTTLELVPLDTTLDPRALEMHPGVPC